MDNEYILNTDGMKFIGAGKIMYDSAVDFRIPALHFLVIQYEKDMYQAVNLEFQLFAAGDTPEHAIAELTALTTTHILTVLKEGNGYNELRHTALLDTMNEYWRQYRAMAFMSSEVQNIGGSVYKYLLNKQEAKIIELIQTQKAQLADQVIAVLSELKKYAFDVFYFQAA